MKTFLGIYGFIEVIMLLWWIYTMLTTKPTFNNGRNRFMKNWNEGGKFVIIQLSLIAIPLAFFVLAFLAVVNVLARLL